MPLTLLFNPNFSKGINLSFASGLIYLLFEKIFEVFNTLVKWNSRYMMRSQLKELSPEVLKAMGMTLEQALEEIEKPFWQS